MWERKNTIKERYSKERVKYALSILPWGYKKLNKRFRFAILNRTILGILPTVTGLYITVLLKTIVNAAVSHDKALFTKTITIYALVSLVNLLYLNLFEYRVSIRNGEIRAEMQKMFYQIIFKKQYGEMEKHRSGELFHRLQVDIPTISNLLYNLPYYILSLLIQFIGSAILIYRSVPEVGIISVPLMIIFSYFTYVVNQRIRRYSILNWEKVSTNTSIMIDHLRNLMLFHTFGKEQYSYESVSDSLDKQRQAENKIKVINALFKGFTNFVMLVITVGGMYYFLSKVVNSQMNIGTYTMLTSLVDRLQQQVNSFSEIIPMLFTLFLSSEKTNEIERADDDMSKEAISQDAALYFYDNELESFGMRNVDFTYPKDERGLVLENYSLEIKKGEFVAITGLSGTGKSTIQKLLLGLYRPDNGFIYLKTKDNRQEMLDSSWRALFSYVPQQNFLIYGTVREILEFGSHSDNSDERCMQALQIACADKFVMEMPMGLDSELGENGAGLSEGQMQRLAIARAIYTQRPILLLDESTSSLDQETEHKILENIKKMTNKTVVIVTHRPAALDYCDKEIHLDTNR